MKAIVGKREYALVRRPLNKVKKGKGSIDLVVNGNPAKALWTSNAGWNSDPATVLEYIWIEVDGFQWFLTLGYGEKASAWAGKKIVTADGEGPKPDPRVTPLEKDAKREADRKAAFVKAYAANREPGGSRYVAPEAPVAEPEVNPGYLA